MVRPSESRYSCTPRVRNSAGYLLARAIIDSFPDPVDQDQKPPEKTGTSPRRRCAAWRRARWCGRLSTWGSL